MTYWVLIMLMLPQTTQSGGALYSQEFRTEEQCLAAKTIVYKLGDDYVKAFCTEMR